MVQMGQMLNESQIAMINFGLHYKTTTIDEYRFEMNTMFKRLKEFASKPKSFVIWRETSAQHVYSLGGEYPAQYHKDLNISYEYWEEHRGQCVAKKVYNDLVPYKWRESEIISIAEENGFRVISLEDSEFDKQIIPEEDEPVMYVLPFLDYSSERSDLHPTSTDGKCEPTHFCYYPQFWEPVWEELARILDLAKYHNKL
jgi:hypothetical protein